MPLTPKALGPLSPATALPHEPEAALEKGIALCLSGGGYRAMLFHTGALWRLLETGYLGSGEHLGHPRDGSTPELGTLERVSSVSGGSIVSALLGLAWPKVQPEEPNALERYASHVVEPIRRLAGTSLAGKDIQGAARIIGSVLLPGSANDHVAAAYESHLYAHATLQDLPERPEFVINAANLQSGALWRFTRAAVRDWKVGKIDNTKLVKLSKAVAASSAFPPFLAPATFEFRETDYAPMSGGPPPHDLQRPPFTTRPVLVDGGVYDNLGLETAYKRFQTILASNGGAPFGEQEQVHRDWARLGKRVIDVMDNQVTSLRKRMLVAAFANRERYGAFWDIEQDIGVHKCPDALPCPLARTAALAAIETDLSKKDSITQERLINWGYAICDAALRGHLDSRLLPPVGFPFAGSGV